MVLSVSGGVAYPKCQREGVHARCRTTSPTAWTLVVHPELGKMYGPQVSAWWCFEGIGGERWWSKAPVHIMNACVLLMSMPLENRMQHRGGVLGMRKRRTEGGEEGLLLEGLQEGFETGPSTSGRVTCVSGYHLWGLYWNGAGLVRLSLLLVCRDHQLQTCIEFYIKL